MQTDPHTTPDAAPGETPTTAPQEPTEPLLRAQAIDCGGLGVAVPFTWARSVIEEFDLSTAPNAPVWLAGAVNVDGRILPVLDLAAWLDETAAQPIDRHSKLLVGGEGEDRFALLFCGLPVMARYAPGAVDSGLATALAPFVLGVAGLSGARAQERWPVIDARALGEQWMGELVV